VPQDCLLEPLQGFAGLDSELVDQGAPRLLVRLESICLAVGAVEGEHLLGPQALSERMLAYEHLQLAEHVLVATLCEVAIDPVQEHDQSQLVELRHLVPSDRFESEPGKRGAAPERERLLQQP
jgi:hypothetical protein